MALAGFGERLLIELLALLTDQIVRHRSCSGYRPEEMAMTRESVP